VPFDGDLDDYLEWLTARREATSVSESTLNAAAQRENRKAQRENAAAERQQKLARRRPLVKEASQLETKIAKLEAQRKELEAQLADPAYYAATPSLEVQATSRRCAELIAQIGDAEERWLEVHAELEEIGEA